MNMSVYYFSGTGNCLCVAKSIAESTNGRLISIPQVIDQYSIKPDAEVVGIVFPAYLAPLSGIPLIVQRFVRKLENIESMHLFAVCTCGGYEIVNALPTLKNLSRLIRLNGGKLSAEYSVRLPMNNLDYDHIPVPINTDQETVIRNCDKKLEGICERILNKKADKHRLLKTLFNCLMTPMYRMMKKSCIRALRQYAKEAENCTLEFNQLIPLTDRSIRVDDQCNGCATCTLVCPVRNIEMVDEKPVWKHHCEMCFACDEWCPQGAIHHWSRADGVKYHHPSVKLKDMFVRANN